jgi:Transmembrane protein 33/Nucleoporin POM33
MKLCLFNFAAMSSNENSEGASAEQSRPAGNPMNWSRLIEHVKAHKLDFALWCTRVCTIFFTLMYFIPLIG